MILAHGKLYDNQEQDNLLLHLEDEINETRETQTLLTGQVVDALVRLGELMKCDSP